MNTMRGDQATVEERREELAGVVGPGDANSDTRVRVDLSTARYDVG